MFKLLLLIMMMAVCAVSTSALALIVFTPTTPGWYAFIVQLMLIVIALSTAIGTYALIEDTH